MRAILFSWQVGLASVALISLVFCQDGLPDPASVAGCIRRMDCDGAGTQAVCAGAECVCDLDCKEGCYWCQDHNLNSFCYHHCGCDYRGCKPKTGGPSLV